MTVMANNKIPRQILNCARENSGEAVILSAGALEKGVGNDGIVVEPMKEIAFIFRNCFLPSPSHSKIHGNRQRFYLIY